MSNLLRSSKFRKNLTKWIISYFIVLGLFATVVTYSKYISSLRGSDETRAAKFDAKVSYINKCSTQSEGTNCEYGDYRPTSDIEVEFKVDNTAMEVSSVFVTDVTIDENFTLKSVYADDVLFTDYKLSGNKLTITENITPTTTYVRNYKLVLNYNYSKIDSSFSSNHPNINIINVGWSATQKD